MKTLLRLLAPGILPLIVLFSSCIGNTSDCANAICTASFAMVTVSLKDSTGADYSPDRVETYLGAQLIHTDTASAIPGQNAFTVVDDSDLQDLGANIDREVIFKVLKNNIVVKDEIYHVKADCCHVSKVSGNDLVYVN